MKLINTIVSILSIISSSQGIRFNSNRQLDIDADVHGKNVTHINLCKIQPNRFFNGNEFFDEGLSIDAFPTQHGKLYAESGENSCWCVGACYNVYSENSFRDPDVCDFMGGVRLKFAEPTNNVSIQLINSFSKVSLEAYGNGGRLARDVVNRGNGGPTTLSVSAESITSVRIIGTGSWCMHEWIRFNKNSYEDTSEYEPVLETSGNDNPMFSIHPTPEPTGSYAVPSDYDPSFEPSGSYESRSGIEPMFPSSIVDNGITYEPALGKTSTSHEPIVSSYSTTHGPTPFLTTDVPTSYPTTDKPTRYPTPDESIPFLSENTTDESKVGKTSENETNLPSDEPTKAPTYDTSAKQIHVDIRPNSCPNKLFPGGKRNARKTIQIAILGTKNFLVQDIDFSSITISGLSGELPIEPLSYRITDATGPIWERETTCECAKIPKDGYKDMILNFSRDDIAAIPEVTSADENDIVTLKIKGVTQKHGVDDNAIDGTSSGNTKFWGQDCLLISVWKKQRGKRQKN